MLRALAREHNGAPPPRDAAARALPRLALLGALVWLTRGILVVAALAFAADGSLLLCVSATTSASPTWPLLAALALGLLAQLGLSVCARRGGSSGAWSRQAFLRGSERRRAPRRAPPHAYVAAYYAGVQLPTLALLLGGGVLVNLLKVAQEGTWRGLLALGTHQIVLLGSILLQVCWLAHALRAARSAQTEAFL